MLPKVSVKEIRETRWPSASRTRSRAPVPLRRRSITVAIMRTCSGRIRVDTEVTQLISNLSPTNATSNTGGGTPTNNRDIAELLTPKTSLPVDHPTSTRLAVTSTTSHPPRISTQVFKRSTSLWYVFTISPAVLSLIGSNNIAI